MLLMYNSNKSPMLFLLIHREIILLIIIVVVLCIYIITMFYYHLMIFLLYKKPGVIEFGFGCCCFYLHSIEAVARHGIINQNSDIINR